MKSIAAIFLLFFLISCDKKAKRSSVDWSVSNDLHQLFALGIDTGQADCQKDNA